MRWLIFLFLTVFGCTETGINKHTVEEKYIYPSYYDVYVEDSGIVIQDTADEENFPVWVDSFVQVSESNGVDILWVIDPSGSMNNEKQYIIDGIKAMILALPNVNWRLVIISSDYRWSGQSTDFPLMQGDSVDDAIAMYNSAVGGAMEAGFDSVYEYIENNQMAQGWMREDAALLTVFVSDEEEQSNKFLPTVPDFTDWYSNLRDNVFVSSIVNFSPAESDCNWTDAYTGYKYIDAANHYNGQVIDICSTDWSAGVTDAAAQIIPYESLDLSYIPVDPTMIGVFVDGQPYYYWHYSASHNRVYFDVVPEAGALVEIAYNYDSNN